MELGVMVGALVDGLGLSAWIFVVTLVGSLPLGIVVALCRMSSFKPLSLLAQFYISILRGTPLMLQLMAFMFGPYYLLGMNMGTDWKFGACAVGFILNYSAYFAEIYRSGIQSIPKGQYEAALVLGYSRSQTFFKIVLPILLMGYLHTGSLVEIGGTAALSQLLSAQGWTAETAVCMMVLCLLHFPCGTTCLTIRRETGSRRWTLLAAALPTAMGMALCIAIHGVWTLLA